mmetsp:Transcript_99593/g.260172  ORF Transcript_99593/g.260172 Transcript_99593/m.260172 type:complete len:213 (-) Transcript_99593:9-647(-)
MGGCLLDPSALQTVRAQAGQRQRLRLARDRHPPAGVRQGLGPRETRVPDAHGHAHRGWGALPIPAQGRSHVGQGLRTQEQRLCTRDTSERTSGRPCGGQGQEGSLLRRSQFCWWKRKRLRGQRAGAADAPGHGRGAAPGTRGAHRRRRSGGRGRRGPSGGALGAAGRALDGRGRPYRDSGGRGRGEIGRRAEEDVVQALLGFGFRYGRMSIP